MTWTIVTVTFNSASTLTKFWREGVPDDVEWIVVDNASSDDSRAVAEQHGARVIGLPRNVGFATANNHGLSEASGEFVGFVNPDVNVDWSSLEHLARVASLGALVAPQLLNPDGTRQSNGRGLPFLVDKFGHRGIQLFGQDGAAYLPDTSNPLTPVAWAMGAAVCGSAATFLSLGGWSERYFIYYEDHELGLRAWSRGVPVIVDSQVRWTHGWARSTSRPDRVAWGHEVRSALRFYSNYPELLLPLRAVAARRAYARNFETWTKAQT